MIDDYNRYIHITKELEMDIIVQELSDSYKGFLKKRNLLKTLKKLPHLRAGNTYQINFYLEPNVYRLPDRTIQTSTKTLYTNCGITVICNLYQPIFIYKKGEGQNG